MTKTSENQFGGQWTQDKLEILKEYLNTYTTALKDQPFSLLYIDAFAGNGRVQQETQSPDEVDRLNFIDGSVKVALDIENKSFDELIFIETDANKCSEWSN